MSQIGISAKKKGILAVYQQVMWYLYGLTGLSTYHHQHEVEREGH
jgi:hypothetical protein